MAGLDPAIHVFVVRERCKPGSGDPLLRDSRDIIRRLPQDGFEQVSVRGSHYKFAHQAKHLTVIVPHPKRDLPLGTVRSIYKQAGWQKD